MNTCKGCPYKNAHNIENSDAITVKQSMNLDSGECHKVRKTPCKGMLNIKK